MTREKGQAFCLLVQAPPGEAGLYSEEGMRCEGETLKLSRAVQLPFDEFPCPHLESFCYSDFEVVN